MMKNAAEDAAQRKFAMEDDRGGRTENERSNDRERGEIESVQDRFEKALVGEELLVVAEPDEMSSRADRPIECAHPNRVQPREDDNGADHDQRGHDEQIIAAAPTLDEARALRRRRHVGCPRIRQRYRLPGVDVLGGNRAGPEGFASL